MRMRIRIVSPSKREPPMTEPTTKTEASEPKPRKITGRKAIRVTAETTTRPDREF